MRTLVSATLLLLSLAVAAQSPERHSRVRVLLDQGAHDLKHLASLGLAVDHGERIPGISISTDLSEAEIAKARANGFACEVLIEDVARFYRERNSGGEKRQHRADGDLCNGPVIYPTPQHFALGSMGGFFTWQEMVDILDAMRADFPQLISVKQSIGQSLEGRDIWMVRLSNNPDVDQDKPEVLYDALHHAREPAGLSQLVFYLWYLLENYGTNAEATYLLDQMELYVVPCINPDGYVYNETTDPDGGGMWRKNRRDNGDGTFGVDLNRNYGQGWGFDDIGSSSDPNSAVYRGTAPFSEPETQAMRDFCNAHDFRLAFNYHTHGNLLVHPWGYLPSTFTPDSAAFVQQGVHYIEDHRYRFGTADQTVGYNVNGGSDDWMYGEQTTKPKIFAMTPEVGGQDDGFWPQSGRIEELSRENVGANLRMAHMAGVYAVTEDRSPPFIGDLSGTVQFSVKRLGAEPGPITVSLEPLANVIGVGAPVVLDPLELLDIYPVSIAITLDPAMLPGETFSYAIALDNGSYSYRDTLTKAYGVADILFTETGSATAWEGAGWGVTDEAAHGAPFSVADSPFAPYASFTESPFTLVQAVDLSDAVAARLNFWAKWEIEARFDHVQVQASVDGASWTPLCGRFTRPGYPDQGEEVPVYDGQQPDWVYEEIDLDGFVGTEVLLRFHLSSNDWREYDGFYFDDLVVASVAGSGPSSAADLQSASELRIFPNPAAGEAWVEFGGSFGASAVQVDVVDALGQVLRTTRSPKGASRIALQTSDLANGLYFIQLQVEGELVRTLHWTVQK